MFWTPSHSVWDCRLLYWKVWSSGVSIIRHDCILQGFPNFLWPYTPEFRQMSKYSYKFSFEALIRKYKYLFLERCRMSHNMWLRALMQSDCLYSSLFFEPYHTIAFYSVNECANIAMCVWLMARHVTLTCIYLDSTSLGIGALICSNVVTSVTC